MNIEIEIYKNYLNKDVWSSKDFTHKRNNNIIKPQTIKFNSVPENFRDLAKLYIYSSLNTKTFSTCKSNLRNIIPFLDYLSKTNKNQTNLKFVEAQHIKDFIVYLESKNKGYKSKNIKILNAIRVMIKSLQTKHPDYVTDINIDFILKYANRRFYKPDDKTKVKYIPEEVIYQFDEKVNSMDNKTDIIISKILRYTGLRCNEVFGLKYDVAIENTEDKYYLVLEQVSKTRILDKHIPIPKELAIEMKTLADEVKKISNKENNPNRYLFIYTDGNHKGKRMGSEAFIKRLNSWSKSNGIKDNNGEIYKFSFHMFRHTCGYELINSGVELDKIKSVLSHLSEDMTLEYTSIKRINMLEEHKKIYGDMIEETKSFQSNILATQDLVENIKYMKTTKKKLGYCIKLDKMKCTLDVDKCKDCSSINNNL